MPRHMKDEDIAAVNLLIPCKGDDREKTNHPLTHEVIYWMRGFTQRRTCPLCEEIEKRQETVERIKTLGEKLEGPTAR